MASRENEIISLLNQAKYIFLRHISEPEDNSLRLVVEEAVADHTQTASNPDPAGPFAEIIPIRATEGCRTFELLWTYYVAYLVTEEVVGSCGNHEGEVYTGNLLRVYTKSHFLDHLARDTGGYSESVLHYRLACLNHLIDVASFSPPEVRLSESGVRVKPNWPRGDA